MDRPSKGVSVGGEPNPDLFHHVANEGAPVEAPVGAVEVLLAGLSEEEKGAVIFGDVETDDWFRTWRNPELYVTPGGIRLDQVTKQVQELVHALLAASLSPEGYKKTLGCTLTNYFCGQHINGLGLMNQHSYSLRLFLPSDRQPSLTVPWGFSLSGHHLCLAVDFVGRRMVVSPTFPGAEPDRIDVGPHNGQRLFSQEETRRLDLMHDLPPEKQCKAQILVAMTTVEGLTEDRWNPFDKRHLGGAGQDNRVVPPEGCPISALPVPQREEVYSIVQAFIVCLTEGSLEYRMRGFAASSTKHIRPPLSAT